MSPDGRPPVAIGGVGGSGTRVVAEVIERAGRYMGSDLNAAHDNLWFTLLFKGPHAHEMPDDEFDRLLDAFIQRMPVGEIDANDRLLAILRELAERPSDQHRSSWLDARLRSLLRPDPGARNRPWGWKEPNTHMVLDRLTAAMPDLRYVHVARSGLDMAASPNQNQPRLWGSSLGISFDGSPASSLRFWCAAHERVLAIGESMGDRFLFLRFEDLCTDPVRSVERLLDFVGQDEPGATAHHLATLVRPPASIGRTRDLSSFSPGDIDYVESLGFAVRSRC